MTAATVLDPALICCGHPGFTHTDAGCLVLTSTGPGCPCREVGLVAGLLLDPGDTICSFEVEGRPRPKGNLRTSPATGNLYDSTRGLGSWLRAIRRAAKAAMDGLDPDAGPIRVDVAFRIAARKGDVLRSGLRAGVEPITRSGGDIDKLARAALDALTAIAYLDDSQVVDLRVRKRYALDAGCSVTVRRAAP